MLTFFAAGVPAPQGSKRAFMIAGKPRLVEMSGRVKPWRRAVHDAARAAMVIAQRLPYHGPVSVTVEFVMPRPKKPSKPACDTRPDIDKLTRSTLDGITGALINDDSQVVRLTAFKRYTRASGIEAPGALISISQVEQGVA